MGNVLLLIATLVCSIQAIRSHRLLLSALWLAGASALLSILVYLLGAPEVAAIELSVGAGLVTVLFVFAINITGEEIAPQKPVVPARLAWCLAGLVVIAAAVLLRGGFLATGAAGAQTGFTQTLWQERQLDVILQTVLIFAGVLSVLGLLFINPDGSKKDTDS